MNKINVQGVEMTAEETDRPVTTQGKTLLFESAYCSRCGGSGNHSYCQMYGTTCFQCGGVGVKLTARGRAAQAFFDRLLSKRTDELRPGDKVQTGAGWATVEVVEPVSEFDKAHNRATDEEHVRLTTSRCLYPMAKRSELRRVAADNATRQAAVDAALAYQATLTQSGKPRKGKEQTCVGKK